MVRPSSEHCRITIDARQSHCYHRGMKIMKRLVISVCLILPSLLRAELTYRTITDFDTPSATAMGGVHYGLDAALVGDGRGNF